VRVAKRDFRPLAEAFPWRCGVIVPERPAEAVGHDLTALSEAFLGGLDEAFRGALGAAAGRRVADRQDDFVREIQAVNREFDDRRRQLADTRDRFNREYKQRQDALEALRKRLTELDDLVFKAGAAAGAALAEGGALRTPLREIVTDTERTRAHLAALEKLTDEISRLARDAAWLADQAGRYPRAAGGDA
jgi:chromosome segregation ATPase